MDRIAVVRVQPYKCDYRLSVKIARVQGPGGYMQLWHARKFVRITVFFWSVTILSFAQNATGPASPAPTPKHFDHVLIVVLENQDYESTMQHDLLRSLARKGAIFSNFGNLRSEVRR